MLNFPVPYPDELLYSTVARAAIHFGITSPKQLLDDVFGNRKVVATVDLPSYLEVISSHYPNSLGLTPEHLAYKHTLFPLYAPFVPEARRQACLGWIARLSKGAAHLALGVVTSRVKARKHLMVCPACMEDQLERYGECYWQRQWQVAGCESCLKHAGLVKTQQRLHNYHRHAFIGLTQEVVLGIRHSIPPPSDKRVEHRVFQLLNLPPFLSPSLEQWGLFYRRLAHDLGITRGDKVQYDLLKERVFQRWPAIGLKRIGVTIDDSQSSWLRLILRKHRKSFSYLEHIVVLEALLGSEWELGDVLHQARKQEISSTQSRVPFCKAVPRAELEQKRSAWLELLKANGVRRARLSGGDALYTWLYRNDQSWLMDINKRHRRTTRSENNRIDWHERDLEVLSRLQRVLVEHESRLESPRRSSNWFCDQAGCRAYLKKLDKLPFTAAFLRSNAEDVASYQVRRINWVMQAQGPHDLPLKRWQLLYLAGLSEERLTKRAGFYLRHIE